MVKTTINVYVGKEPVLTYKSDLVPEKGDILHNPSLYFAKVLLRSINLVTGEVDLTCIAVSAEEAGYA